MSLERAGVWAEDVWASTVWAIGVWYESGLEIEHKLILSEESTTIILSDERTTIIL